MDDFEDRGTRRAHGGPYTAKHPVPTVRGYREHRAELKRREDETEDIPASDQAEADSQQPSDSKTKRAYDSLKAIAKDEDKPEDGHTPYPHANRNADGPPDKSQSQFQPGFQGGDHDDNHSAKEESNDDDDGSHKHKKHDEKKQTATETVAGSIDPKEKRKTMKKAKRSGNGREVTDPVTHLPVVIHDMTDRDLHACPENEPGAGEQVETLTGGECEKKDEHQLEEERRTGERGLKGMRGLFPGPRVGEVKGDMVAAFQEAFLVAVGCFALFGVAVVGGMSMLMRHESSGGWLGGHETARRPWLTVGLMLAVLTAVAGAGLYGAHGWLSQKVDNILEDEVWDAARQQEIERNDSEIELPESAAWLNSMLASVWRLINPDLFSALVDTLEDVMQASLPKIVRMVSVDDIGQGSEAFRILGIRWLPTGAAGQSVDSNGKLRPAEDNDRKVAGQGQQDEQSPNKGDEQSGQDQEVQEGMEAEEGDFVNLELAFAYRARTSGKSIKSKAKNAHLYLKFYLPGNIAVPVWVELRGIVGIMRLRLQLTPDPPFFQLCTLTFLGQPRADLSCVPLSKHSLNLMNVPLISSFVQSSIDAALAEYVAPKSLTLDLKDMLMGDDFKKDTLARGVMLVHIKRARDFKEGDGGLGPLKKGSSDSYVSVSWGKFGKPVACTRIIKEEQEPNWDEWAMVLVTSDEINAEETLRLQLWDSDKHTADDDLGRVEVNLKEIMHGSRTKNRMCDREDELRADDLDEKMPGTLTWSVGYFSKAHIQQCQLNKQTFEPSIRSIDGIKERVSEDARSKLREAMASRDVSDELKQQEAQDGKELEDMMIISAPPPEEYPSGILGIQIHNITGLEVAKLNRSRSGQGEDREDESEQSGELPDSYCTVILNHKKIYRTRTKPKNAKPFFNAGTERFVKDWRTAEVIVSVRDSREGENDPLLGVVYLPLRRVFDSRSQIMGTYPLAGGIGYGRARISMVWRSVELKMPKELTGWDYGTLEVIGAIKAVDQLPEKLKGCKLKLRTKTNKAKMYSHQEEGVWKPKHEDENVFLGVTKRYASPVVIHFCDSSFMSEDNPDLAVLWLTGIPDEEEQTVKVKVWKGGKHQLRRAKSCTDYRGLDEGEEPLGEIELKVRFWRGLSGYHKAYAGKEKKGDVKGVMEVLDTVNDEKMGEDNTDSDSEDEFGLPKRGSSQEEINKRKMLRKAGDDSSSDDGDNEGPVKTVKSFPSKIKNRASSLLDGKGGDEDDGRRGVVSQVQDYKRNHKQLHRKHRGVMQWKATRTLDWMVDKARQSKGKVEGLGHHGEKEQGIETEV
ncbi:hypothetical protein QBC34DRAFT_59671 [Podospora aff. communis PSN243]|uniref:Meiotically up-regulated gene 190 protein n=1 Tax=Podospora aff. communis PSN243 TaxID=3040156 RepID=A0AAV9GR76_9PEZI|nr:hypothetical protein QBC34DRAFT_59671 [Podospora aff. communis PSN243]